MHANGSEPYFYSNYTCSETGVVGDPTLATRAKGEQMFTAVTERMVELVREFRDRPREPRHDMHAETPRDLFGLRP